MIAAARLRSVCAIVSTLMMSMAVTSQVTAGDAREADPIQFVLEQNRSAREQLRSIAFSYTSEEQLTPFTGPPFNDVRRGKVQESGNNKYWDVSGLVRVESRIGPPSVASRVEKRMVVTGRFVATWRIGASFAVELTDITSVSSLHPSGSLQMRDVGEDVLQYAYGTREGSLLETYKAQKHLGTWTIQSPSQGTIGSRNITRILRTWTAGAAPWVMLRCDINNDTGLIEHLQTYVAADTPAEEQTVRARELTPGVWVPVEVSYAQSHAVTSRNDRTIPRGSLREIGFRKHIILSDVVVNQPIPDSAFELRALGAPDGKGVAHKYADGHESREFLWDGAVVPREVHYEFLHAKLARSMPPRPVPHTGRRVALISASVAALVAIILASRLYKGRRRVFRGRVLKGQVEISATVGQQRLSTLVDVYAMKKP